MTVATYRNRRAKRQKAAGIDAAEPVNDAIDRRKSYDRHIKEPPFNIGLLPPTLLMTSGPERLIRPAIVQESGVSGLADGLFVEEENGAVQKLRGATRTERRPALRCMPGSIGS